jgi:hypothetical protein
MRIKLKERVHLDVDEWHDYFLWFPKVVEGNLVFCEKVQRCRYYRYKGWIREYYWTYRLIERKE